MRRWLSLPLTLLVASCGGGGSRGSSSLPGKGMAPVGRVEREIITTKCAQPVQYVASSANRRLAYVVERLGRVRVLIEDALQERPILDISSEVDQDGEGLLGMTLAPNFARSGAFYLQFVALEEGKIRLRVRRYVMNSDGRSASSSGENILMVEQPFVAHKGGSLNFGSDGYLYLALGDGGDSNDPFNNAQKPDSLLGKVLRIDPNGDDFPSDPENNYRVPPTNPFVRTAGVRNEIWAFGLRNPFRWSFDSKTGAMLMADVGQEGYEEINFEPAGRGGRNYGWRIREGRHETGLEGPAYPGELTDPCLDYDRSVGKSVTGGYVVRTLALGHKDRYLFGDFISGKLWSIPISLLEAPNAFATVGEAIEIQVAEGWKGIVSIDPDAKGTPVITEFYEGRISRLLPGESE